MTIKSDTAATFISSSNNETINAKHNFRYLSVAFECWAEMDFFFGVN